MRHRAGCAMFGAALLSGWAATASGQAGSTAAIILELPASSRALALGGAAVALPGDESAIFYNPAGLADVRTTSAGLSVQAYLAQGTLGALSAASRVGRGTVALGVQVLDYGGADEVVPDPASGGERGIATGGRVTAGDYVVSLAYATAVRRARLGAAAKWVAQRLAGESANAAAVDVGVAMTLWRGSIVGASLQNVGSDLELAGTATRLPRTIRGGLALPVTLSPSMHATATADVARSRGGGARVAGGVEVGWAPVGAPTFLARLGALSRPVGSLASPVTFGGGLRTRHLALDYAYQGFDSFGGTHRVGVRWWR